MNEKACVNSQLDMPNGDALSLDRLLSELQLPTLVEKLVREKLSRSDLTEIVDIAYSSEDFNFPLCRRMPLTRLAVLTILLQKASVKYKESGVEDEIIFETFRDVSLRATLFYQRNKKAGISKDDVIWFRHIVNVNIFKLGALQFQPFEMIYLDEETIGEQYMTFAKEQKLSLPTGMPVINCHIQRGANLTPDLVTASLTSAKTFFSRCFPDKHFQVFLCYSWLLYPQMANHLPTTSNIRHFFGLFDIIGSCNDSEQAEENLFPDGKYKELPQMTSLQRMAVDHKDWFGYACGIIEI